MNDDRVTVPPPVSAEAPPAPPATTPAPPPHARGFFSRLFGWLAGVILLTVAGWGLIYAGYWLTGSLERSAYFTAPISLALLYFLEQNLWLSRFMGLRLGPNASPAKETLFFWVTGVPGLLWRSTLETPAPEGVPAQGQGPAPVQQVDSVREVVETIVFVVVLVLLLKSFAAEAFVIPTGSMAETLYGYQKLVKCPKCEYHFPVNASSEADAADGSTTPIYACTCPNCMQEIHFPRAPERYLRSHANSVMVPDPGVNSGDRVLVAKFTYDLLNRIPDRLNVVVFKYPGDERFPMTGPSKNHVPMNYIKRLVGLPGETIAIHGGNLYALPPEKNAKLIYPDDLFGVPEEKRDAASKMLWREGHMHENFRSALDSFSKGDFEIIRKNPAQVLTMRRIVFDNDHPPTDLKGKLPPRWQGAPGWTPGADNSFTTAPAAGDSAASWLRYRHILRDRGGKPQLISDFMGYNSWDNEGQHRGHPTENWVGDLSLDCEVQIDRAEGELILELSRSVDRFRARFDLANGKCTLTRIQTEHEETEKPEGGAGKTTVKDLGDPVDSGVKSGTYRLRFANVDNRLTVWVNDKLIFGDGVPYPAAKYELPTNNDLEPASVGSHGAAVTVRHLSLWRDTYYTVKPSMADLAGMDWFNPDSWKEPLPTKTLYVQPHHFLCLGDNSPESSDGRSWGLVPERLLLGRALLVYFPVGRAGRIR